MQQAGPPSWESDHSSSGERVSHPLELTAVWQRLEPLLDAVLDAEPEARAALLRQLASSEPALVPLIAPLLGEGPDPLGEHALDALVPMWRSLLAEADGTETALVPNESRIGAYRVVALLGRGGMGDVYRAERADGAFAMPVALKLGRADARVPDEEVGRRLLAERQLLARLSHRNIARLLDGGVASDGRPYLVMELVEGVRLTEFARRRQLDRDARLRLFLQVCRAVEHAHRHLIVHGDLKPANVLVTEDGTVKLLDFGVATVLRAGDEPSANEITPRSPPRATVAYASPEQLRGEPLSIASDIYSLGLLLCDLLELPRPDAPAPTGAPHLPADFVSLLRTALQQEPTARYPTVEALARDVQAFLARDVIAAHPATVRYRLGRFVSRHRTVVALLSLLCVSSLGFGLMATSQARQLARAADRAAADRDRAVRASGVLLSLFGSVSPYAQSIDSAPTPKRMLDSAVVLIERERERAPDVAATLLSAAVEAYHGVGDWQAAERVARVAVEAARQLAPVDSIGLGWHLLRLGLEQHYAGRGDAGEAALREALSLLQRSPEDGGRPEARARNALAVHLARRGFGDDAVMHARRALALDSTRRPVDPVLVAQSHRTLGHALRAAGALDAAQAAYERAWQETRAAFGDAHAETGNALINLGVVLREAGHPDSAVTLMRAGLALRNARLGVEHPDLAIDERQFAEALLDDGQVDSAAYYSAHAVTLLERTLPRSLELLQARRVAAQVLHARGQTTPACDALREQRTDLARDGARYRDALLGPWEAAARGCVKSPPPR